MKKNYLIVLLVFVMSFLFVGCSKKVQLTLEEDNVDLIVGDTYEIKYAIQNNKSNNDYIVVASTDAECVSIDGLTIKALSAGKAIINVMIEGKEKTKQTLTINVNNKLITNITIKGDIEKIIVGNKAQASVEVLPEDATIKDIVWSTSDEKVITINNEGEITAVGKGEAKVIATSKDGSNIIGERMITVIEKDLVKPTITMDDNKKLNMTIGYNDEFKPLEGVKAFDNVDGDITSKIEVRGRVNTRKVGTYELTYTVKDNQNNVSDPMKREIKVVWDSTVTFIGHAGCYSGLMNSEEAFRKAFTVHGYQGIECDVKQTKDGVFVTSHGDEFDGKQLNAINYNDLKDVVHKDSRGGITYYTKICTFRKYLQIAKENNGFCVVELKWSNGINNNDQSRMPALMKEIEEEGMLHHVIFLASQYKCLEWVRNNGYDYIPCQYLVNSCESKEIYDRCVKNNFDISFNIQSLNRKEWIDRYHDAGLKVACYTFTQFTDKANLQSWIDAGVDFVTVDNTKPYEVKLPKKSTEEVTKYDVTFKDYDGTVIKVTHTPKGEKAVTPINPERKGYKFVGWDKDITNITGPLEVTALYEKINYKITYQENTVVYKTTEWENKQAFVNEFYTDWFNWLDKNVGVIEGLTKKDGVYTFSYGGKEPSWKDVNGLKGLSPYDVEKTIGCFAYKPVENRETPTTPVDPVEDNGYFLNTEPYRTKYSGMDEYLINCIAKAYTHYSYNYNKSSGRVQIFFRFHQWCNGTGIPSLDKYPTKVEQVASSSAKVTLPTTNLTYTVDDEFVLPIPTCNELEFTGWYLDATCTKKIEKTEKGSTGDLVLYAGWKEKA